MRNFFHHLVGVLEGRYRSHFQDMFLTKSQFICLLLGTGHKLTARVGWSDLGWAMENLWAVSMGRQFFCLFTVGPPNKNPC